MPFGTKITIENLFANTPVRKKFLKSERTEFRHILDIVQNNALAHPRVGFELIHNDKNVLFLAENDTLENRIINLFGATSNHHSIPIKFEELFLKLTGVIGRPQLSYTNTQKLFIL